MGKTSRIILETSKIQCFLHLSEVFLIEIKNVYSMVLNQNILNYRLLLFLWLKSKVGGSILRCSNETGDPAYM